MNTSIEVLLRSFLEEFTLLSTSESAGFYKCEVRAKNFVVPTGDCFATNLAFLNERDSIEMAFMFGSAEPVSFFSRRDNTSDFVARLTDDSKYLDDEELTTVRIEISKRKVDSKISIYDFSSFADFVKEQTFSTTLSIFDDILGNEHAVVFEVASLSEAFRTETMLFRAFGSNETIIPAVDRLKTIEMIRGAGFFSNLPSYRLTPFDFHIVGGRCESSFRTIFDMCAETLSVVYLFDITSVNGEQVEYKLNGYTSIKGIFDAKVRPLASGGEYLEIFRWVYTGGNLHDKIGLARNLISLNLLRPEENLSIRESTLQSIKSSHKLYEKQNIKQYLEVRNKISDQLLEFFKRANGIVESFTSGLQKSILAVTSFFFSTIALKALGGEKFSFTFSLDVTLISSAYVVGSILYFGAIRWEVAKQRKRFENSYFNMKERYCDLLDKSDIERILNHDKEYGEDLAFIDNKVFVYTLVWVLITLLLISLIVILRLLYISNQHMMNGASISSW